jgi:hypothetical protein
MMSVTRPGTRDAIWTTLADTTAREVLGAYRSDAAYHPAIRTVTINIAIANGLAGFPAWPDFRVAVLREVPARQSLLSRLKLYL